LFSRKMQNPLSPSSALFREEPSSSAWMKKAEYL